MSLRSARALDEDLPSIIDTLRNSSIDPNLGLRPKKKRAAKKEPAPRKALGKRTAPAKPSVPEPVSIAPLPGMKRGGYTLRKREVKSQAKEKELFSSPVSKPTPKTPAMKKSPSPTLPVRSATPRKSPRIQKQKQIPPK